ncbi:multidrug efflux ABC transporter permease [Alteromonas gracilis]
MLTGTRTMIAIWWRTGRVAILGWIAALLALSAVSAASIASLYDTPAKLQGYADSITGDTMTVLNGQVAGLGTLGGTLANELAFVVALLVPLMAIALTVRTTRREEESGRLELLLASRIAHLAPLSAAIIVSTVSLLVLGLGLALLLIAFGAAVGGSLLYGLGVTALGWVFVGVTAVAAQLVLHGRSVWGIGIGVLAASYLGRGRAAVTDSPLLWLTPHGIVDEVRAFGGAEARAWPLLIAVALAVALVALAVRLAARRDLDDALLPSRAAPPRASRLLATPVGLALHQHRGATLGWGVGVALLMGVYGGLTRETLSAIEDNPTLGELIGAGSVDAADFLDRILSVFVMMLGILVAAYVVSVVGGLRSEEREGRLEVLLSGHASRPGWLGVHLAVAAVGALVVGLAGALAFGASTAASLDDSSWVGRSLVAAAAYVPVALLFLGLAGALVGALPRAWPLAWTVFGAAAFLGYLGPGLDLPAWLVDHSPFLAVGEALFVDGADVAGLVSLTLLAALLLAVAFIGFRRRDVPRL